MRRDRTHQFLEAVPFDGEDTGETVVAKPAGGRHAGAILSVFCKRFEQTLILTC